MWYIDSWAVIDGLGFASQRHADAIDASATVFLSVPDLEPVPVGRISSALRAQRNNFQDGFRDRDGNEIGFDELDQIRDLIRRAYFGGGLGPTPAPVEPTPIDPFLREGEELTEEAALKLEAGRPEEHYQRALARVPTRSKIRADYGDLQYPSRRRPLLESLFQSPDLRDFFPCLQAFGEATVMEIGRRRKPSAASPDGSLPRQWLTTLWRTGLWDEIPELWTSDGRLAFMAYAFPARNRPLFRVPCPLLPSWDPHIHTLHHKLLLPLTLRHYFDVNRDLAEFIPLLFCGMVIAGNSAVDGPPAPRFRDSHRSRLLGRALLWLTTELPSIEQPDGVEEYLTEFAIGQLHQNPERS
jgi:hypothetical protein